MAAVEIKKCPFNIYLLFDGQPGSIPEKIELFCPVDLIEVNIETSIKGKRVECKCDHASEECGSNR